MKNIIKLNIGLNDTDNQPLNVHTACLAVESYGLSILASRVHNSPAGNEKCLVISAQYRGNDLPASIYALAVALRQDCIAYWAGGKGTLRGPGAEAWGEFNPAFFVGLTGETLAENTPLKNESAELENEEQFPEEFNGFTRRSFREYLEYSIIPDSIEAGFDGYAEDLKTALHFLTH